MSKHTPGPWEIGEQDSNGRVSIKDATPIIQTGGCWDIAAVWNDVRADEAKPNARLIAAAPELLAALSSMVKAVNVKSPDPLIVFASIEKAREAIEKAKP